MTTLFLLSIWLTGSLQESILQYPSEESLCEAYNRSLTVQPVTNANAWRVTPDMTRLVVEKVSCMKATAPKECK